MILLLLFSFLAGIVTVLSPCILPLLPVILTGSTSTGNSRPWGIITGFVVSFTIFTLFLAMIVSTLGISVTIVRSLAIAILFIVGFSLLWPSAQARLEQLLSRFSTLAPSVQNKTGFGGGLLIGSSLGLLWTPCVGPILGAVISVVLINSISPAAVLIMFAFSIGTAIPMFGIILGGRDLLQKNTWFVQHAANVQKVFGSIMIITAIGVFFNIDRQFQVYFLDTFPGYSNWLTGWEEHITIRRLLEQLIY